MRTSPSSVVFSKETAHRRQRMAPDAVCYHLKLLQSCTREADFIMSYDAQQAPPDIMSIKRNTNTSQARCDTLQTPPGIGTRDSLKRNCSHEPATHADISSKITANQQ